MFKWAMLCGWPNSGESLFETRPKKREFNKREKSLEVGFHRAYRMTSLPVYARVFAYVCSCMCVCACVCTQDQILLSRNFEASFLCLFFPSVKEYRLAAWQRVWSCTVYRNCHARTSSNTHTKSNLHQGEVEGGAEVTGQTWIVWWQNTCELCFEQKMKAWLLSTGHEKEKGMRRTCNNVWGFLCHAPCWSSYLTLLPPWREISLKNCVLSCRAMKRSVQRVWALFLRAARWWDVPLTLSFA